jgi:site-specific DNA-adenine methylase
MSVLSSEDKDLIKRLKALPDDYWDFKNEDTKELTHGLHTYPAVMVYPISRKIIDMMQETHKLNSLLDPFMGSGTVLVEAMLAGYNQIYGVDLNPLAQLISKVKMTVINSESLKNASEILLQELKSNYNNLSHIINGLDEYVTSEKGLDVSAKNGWGDSAPSIIKEYFKSINFSFEIPEYKNIGYWFKPKVILELQILKNTINDIQDKDIRDFLYIAMSETIRLVSNRRNGEFKMFRMTAENVTAHNPSVLFEFTKILNRNIEKMNDFEKIFIENELSPNFHIVAEDTRFLNNVPNDSIDIMITSPPYGDSRTTVAYGEFSRLSLQWLDLCEVPEDSTKIDSKLMGGKKYSKGFDNNLPSETLKCSLDKIKSVDLARAGDVYSFYKDLNDCLRAISAKMRMNSYQFWVVGNRTVKLETLQTDKIITELGTHYGLQLIFSIPRNIPNKVMPSLNSPTNVAGKKAATMTNEHIVILRKTKSDCS